MRFRQRGVTFIGWIVLLIPLAIVAYAGVRLTPIYLNYMKVTRSLDSVATEYSANDGVSAGALRNSLGKRFDIESVDYPNINDIKITKDGKSWTIEADFADQAPLFSNLSLQVAFDKVVRIGSVE